MTTTTDHRRRTTVPLDRDLLARAQAELGTETITETVERALQLALRGPRAPLGASGKPPVARRVRQALGEAGFGSR